MGGTFDPIHYGHLAAAEEARELMGLSKVIFVPSGHPPHKDPNELLAAEHRLAMTQLAIADNRAFSVSRVELDREGPTYTIDTLRSLEQQLPDCELVFIAGADMLLDLASWKDPDKILESYHFAAVTRPGWNLSHLPGRLAPLYERYRSHMHILQVPGVAISSTEIRERLQSGRSARYLVPEDVLHYVEKQGLYRQRVAKGG